MINRLAISVILIITSLGLSLTAHAGIRLSPSLLICPETRQGQESDCGTLSLQNTNLLLAIKVKNVSIGSTDNFTLDTSACLGKTLSAGQSCDMPVTFHPQDGGGYSTVANAVYTYWGFSKEHKRTARVYGLSIFPIVRLSTDDIAFGDQTVDTSHRQYVKMENIGTDALTISSMSVPLGSGFSTENDCGTSLAAGNYCGILVYFEPTEAEDYISTLEIVDDASTSPQQISLSGTGIAAGSADINIEKTVINYGEQTLDSQTTETITITSTGTVNLAITSITASGAPFTQTNDCPATLAPEETCTISATFEPTTASSFEGTITLVDTATDSPQTITLKGKGVSPNASVIPSLIDFGNQTIDRSSLAQEIVLLNSGTSVLTITDISSSSTLYAQSNTCGTTLDPKEECIIQVIFTPTATGASSATISVTTDDPSSPARVFLFGNGITGPDVDISPPLYDFGKTPAGQVSETQTFTIKNTGEGNLTLSAITVNSDFEQTNECPDTLIEEQTCDVETAFVPMTAGNFFGTLSVVDNAEGSPHTAHLIGFGTSSVITIVPASIDFGPQTIGHSSLVHDVRLLNSGNDAITIESIASSNAVFAQTNDCPATLAPADFCTINITFTPTAADVVTAQITISDSVAGSPHNIDLSGSGLDPQYPDLDLAPKTWDFGQILVGDTSDAKAFTLKNTGVVDVTITGIDANSEFAQTNDCPGTLSSGETCTINGTFSPQASGAFSGYITVIDNTPSRYQKAYLSGTASHAGDIDISFSASLIDFGTISTEAESDVQSIILTNAGSDAATIGAVSLAGSEASSFSIDTNCNSRSLDVGASCLINAVFKPVSSGQKLANIMVYNDAHDSPQAISLKGTGANPSGCSLQAHASSETALLMLLMLVVVCGGIGVYRRRHQRWS